jgi:hypothetical protein
MLAAPESMRQSPGRSTVDGILGTDTSVSLDIHPVLQLVQTILNFRVAGLRRHNEHDRRNW